MKKSINRCPECPDCYLGESAPVLVECESGDLELHLMRFCVYDNLKHKKCKFEMLETEYLGLVVSQNAVKMDPAKVSAIHDWPVPTSKKDLYGFLGFLNFYHHFIKNFVQLARSLNALTSIKRDFVWDNACQTMFTALKEALSTTPALAMSTDFDPYCIETDASGFGVGVVLSQCQDSV